MAILWITPKWPLPPHDGARRATVQLLQDLSSLGQSIDLLALAGTDEVVDTAAAQSLLGVRRAYVIRRPGRRSGFGRVWPFLGALTAPCVPLTMQPFRSAAVRAGIARRMNDEQPSYAAVVYDGLHPAAHAFIGGRYHRPCDSTTRIIYRAHNREALIWERKAIQSQAFLRPFFQWQASCVRAVEDALVSAADGIAPVSAEDLQLLQAGTTRAEVVPIGYAFDRLPAAPQSPRFQLLFLGTLDWPPNREGLHWFLEKVWPAVAERRADMDLVIAGSGESSWLAPLLTTDRTLFLGRVPEVDPLYADASVALVPIFFGSGTRVKAIEAARFGRACLSTAIGVEGVGLVPGTSYLQAETPEQWIDTLLHLTPERAIAAGVAAFEAARTRFDRKQSAQQFLRLLG